MAISGKATTISALVIILSVISSVNAKSAPMSPSPAPAPSSEVGSDCMSLIYNMADCLTYVEKGSNSTKPDKSCCPELAAMLGSQPKCLCVLLAKSSDFPVELDLNRALKLPSACGLKTPPLTMCSTAGSPAGSPTSSEGPSSSSSPDGLAPTDGKNGASKAKGSAAYFVAALAMAYASLLTL